MGGNRDLNLGGGFNLFDYLLISGFWHGPVGLFCMGEHYMCLTVIIEITRETVV